ncbi:MAG: response regulator [Desulfotalea sp.]
MKKQIVIVLVFWLFAIIASLGWNISDDKRESEKLAIKYARALFQQIVLDRSWNAGHGGVYVPVTADTQPNPYLYDPLRDVTTLEGLKLTKINPSYMTRQIAEIASIYNGVQFHITSLKPIRPANKPADWEARWLHSFEDGAEEQNIFASEDGDTFFRYMAPLLVKKGCLDCHAEQGYKLGEIKGGISVTIPFVEVKSSWSLWVSHGVALLVGFLGILLFGFKNSLAEAKRRENEILLQGTLESTADGILVVNDKGLVMQTNGQFGKLWNVPTVIIENPNEYKLRNHVRDQLVEPLVFLAKVEALYSSMKEDFDTLHLKDGRIFEHYSQPLVQQGIISGRVWSFRDITDRKKAEEELQKLSMATEQSPVSVVITDPKGTIEYVNPTFTNVSGYSFDEVIGQNHKNLKSDKQSLGFYQKLWETINDGKEWHGELANKKKNGEIYWESISISPIRNSKGEVTHFVEVREDVTEKKASDEALNKRAKKLTDARLAMLNIMEDLDDAKEKAEEATKAKSNFLANMSHEIRTPMNAIIGMSHLALKTDLTPKQIDYLSKIDISAKNLLGIINDILDFSKIEAGKLEMESSNFQLDDVLGNLANLIGIKSEEKNLELLFNVDQNTPTGLIGDPLRLGQILINLTNNAVKFTEIGEIIVTVSAIEKSESKATLQFSVHDSGIGLTEEQRSKLFQAFSQADTSTTRKYGGTGLGLTISKKLCKLMGGEIWVESVHGKGSTFIFTAKFGLQAENRIPLLPEPDLRGKRVLVVDDSKASCEIIHEMLESMTFDVSQALSGNDALTEISNSDAAGKPYEVIFMDWQMPGLDGIATSKKIKELKLSCPPKIIMVTSYGREEIMQLAKDFKLDGFLVKPVSHSLLFDATMQVFGREGIQINTTRIDKGSDIGALKNIRGARILLAEDNEINQQVVQEILEQAALVVEIANNGKEAVGMAEKNPYDVILMDIQMPEMNGFDATKEIRKLEAVRPLIAAMREQGAIPIIAMTAHAMAGDREKSIEGGMNDHITKPIDPDQLFNTLLKWIDPGEREIPEYILRKMAVETQESEEERFPALPGIAVKEGLARVAGNKKMYLDLLKRFMNSQRDVDVKIQKALKENDSKLAERLAHTAKGVSGNIGATSLHEAAGNLEIAIRSDNNIEEKSVIHFTEELNKIISVLENAFPPKVNNNGSVGKFQTSTIEQIQPLLVKLYALLADDDGEAVDYLREIEGKLTGVITQFELKQLHNAVAQFDFEKALNSLKQIIKNFNINIEE